MNWPYRKPTTGGPCSVLTCPECGAQSEPYWPGIDPGPAVQHRPECPKIAVDPAENTYPNSLT
jgi:hypothetical protein